MTMYKLYNHYTSIDSDYILWDKKYLAVSH